MGRCHRRALPPVTAAAELVLSTPAITWARWWLRMECGCQWPRDLAVNRAAPKPETPMRDIVARLRCSKCGRAPTTVTLRSGPPLVATYPDPMEVVLVSPVREAPAAPALRVVGGG